MRNCLPKIFRTKSSSSSSVSLSSSSTSARVAAGHSNELDGDSDAERYVIAKPTTAKFTGAVDQPLDKNANKKLHQQQLKQQPPATATTTTTQTTTATTSSADDVDKNRLISADRIANSNSLDLETSNNSSHKQKHSQSNGNDNGNGNGNQTATNGSIRQVVDTNVPSKMKVDCDEILLAAPVPVPLSLPLAVPAPVPAPAPASVSLSVLPGNSNKTPEQMEREYAANEAAEGRDIMTPLLRSTRSLSMAFASAAGPGGSAGGGEGGSGGGAAGVGRIMQPEIVEAIRNLDTQALRLNNLTLEDRLKLTQLTQRQESTDGVVVRPKPSAFDRQTHSLYERRLHKGPKLRLWVGNGKKPSPQADEDEFKTFQVFTGRHSTN